MCGDKIDRPRKGPVAGSKNIRRSGEPCCKAPEGTRITAPEFAEAVARLVVPFAPRRWKSPKLIAPGSKIPRFRDMNQILQQWILRDRREQRMIRMEAIFAAAKHGSEIVAEAIDTRADDRCAQRFEREAHDHRALQSRHIATAGIVGIEGRFASRQPVISGIVKTAQ